MAKGSNNFFHVNSASAGQVVSINSGTILRFVNINTAAVAATSSVLTLFDASTAAQATAANTIAVCNVQNTAIPGLIYNAPLSRGLFYTYVQTGAVTTVGDFTIVFV